MANKLIPHTQCELGGDPEFFVDREYVHSIPYSFKPDSSVPVEAHFKQSTDIEVIFSNFKKWLRSLSTYTPECIGGPYVNGYVLGNHIHFGGLFHVKQVERMFMDTCLAWVLAGVIPYIDLNDRAKFYGKLCQTNGRHSEREYKKHGFEYRALPAPFTLEYFKASYGLAHFVVRIIMLARENNQSANDIIRNTNKLSGPLNLYGTMDNESYSVISKRILSYIWKHMNSDERSGVCGVKRLLKEGKLLKIDNLIEKAK